MCATLARSKRIIASPPVWPGPLKLAVTVSSPKRSDHVLSNVASGTVGAGAFGRPPRLAQPFGHVGVRDDPLGLGAEHRVAAGVVTVVMRVEHRVDRAPAGLLLQPLDADLRGVGKLRVHPTTAPLDRPATRWCRPSRENADIAPDVRELAVGRGRRWPDGGCCANRDMASPGTTQTRTGRRRRVRRRRRRMKRRRSILLAEIIAP